MDTDTRPKANHLKKLVSGAAIAAGLGALVIYDLREILAPGFDRVPGTDAGLAYSWELYTRSVLTSGRLPYWNPYQFGGVPHLADPQVAVLYPGTLLTRLLTTPLAFLPWILALHLSLVGVGMLFLARVAGSGWPAATAAATAVTFGGSVTAWLIEGHLAAVTNTAWLPWALAFAILSVRRTTLLPHPGLVCVMVLHFLAGSLHLIIYSAAAVCLYFLYSAVVPDRLAARPSQWRPIVQLALVAAIATGLTAFQLLPTTTLVAEAGRTYGIPYQTAVRGSWSVTDLATFFYPTQAPSAYIGWLLVCSVPFAFFDRARIRLVIFFLILATLSIALAFGENLPLYQLHYAAFPGLRIPVRVLYLATVSAALLGTIGLERLIGAASRREWTLLLVLLTAALTGAAIATIVVSGGNWPEALTSRRWPWIPLLALASLGTVIGLARGVGTRFAQTSAVVLVALDVTVRPGGALETHPVTPVETVRQWLGAPDSGRVHSLCRNMVGPRELMDGRHPSFEGFGSVSLRNQSDWTMLLSDGGPPLRARRDLLDLSGVSRVVSCRELDEPGLSLLSQVDSVYVYRNDHAWPRAVWTCGALKLTRRQVIEQLRDVRYSDGRLVPQHFVSVQWSDGLSDDRRRVLEQRYGLALGVYREGTTWRYQLHDRSHANTVALLRDPAVQDTHGIDRGTGTLAQSSDEIDPRGSEPDLLIGAAPCSERGDVELLVLDQPDGRVAVVSNAPVDGIIFFTESYYPERQAFVDDQRVTPLRANLAFTAVPVPAGKHHVELRYVPSSFVRGIRISAATLLVWIGAMLFDRSRARRSGS